MERSKYKIYGLMVLATIFWAGAFIAGKLGVGEFPPYSIAFFRFLFATAIIFPIMLKYEKNDWKLAKNQWAPIIVIGIVGMFGYHVLFFKSLQFTTAVNSSLIGATNPLVTSILAAIFLKEVLGWKRVGAFSLALVGVTIAIFGDDLSQLGRISFNQGDILMMLAVICWSSYAVLSKQVSKVLGPLKITAYSFLVCLVVLVPFVLIEKPMSYIGDISWRGWTAVLYMAIFPSVMGYLIQQIAIKEIGPSTAAAFINLVPIFSTILSIIILNEKVTWIKLLGGLIIISGVYLNTRLRAKTVEA